MWNSMYSRVCVFNLLDLLSGGAWLSGSSDAVGQGMWWVEWVCPWMRDPAGGVGQPSGAGSQAEHLNDGLGNLQIKPRFLMFNFKWLNMNI